jgi:hypothetical protein
LMTSMNAIVTVLTARTGNMGHKLYMNISFSELCDGFVL